MSIGHFFFQAEDGIRDGRVTGVQTCALPISICRTRAKICREVQGHQRSLNGARAALEDRKSTRLNSSHPSISYAVFCLKKKTTCSATSPAREHGCRAAASALSQSPCTRRAGL